jgi:hypothetical protein
MNRQTLRTILWLLAGVAVVFTAIPFVRSLLPTDRARNNSTHAIDITGLAKGNYRVSRIGSHVIYIVHKADDSWNAFSIPLRENKVEMPDIHWWRRSGSFCNDFSPTMTGGLIATNSRFRCADIVPENMEWWFSAWQWDIDGHWIPKPGSTPFDDMPRAKFELNGDRMYIRQPL